MMNIPPPMKQLPYFRDQQPFMGNGLFQDPFFPPNSNSLLGLDSFGKIIDPEVYRDNMKELQILQNVTFARPSEIFGPEYKLFSGNIEVNDIKQGLLGDCYFLTALGNLCKFPGLIMKIFKTQQVNPNGYYELVLRIDGRPMIVIVDDFIPVDKNTRRPCFAMPNGNELWVILLEKAWAKINGGYINAIGGRVNEPFEVLTGFGSRVYNISNINEDAKKEILEEMKEADKSNCFISCGTKHDESIQNFGLVDGHAYTIIGLNVIETIYRDKYTLLQLRNPWSHKEWNGDWSDNSMLWDQKTKSQVNYKKSDDGMFYMSDKDFFKFFDTLQICYMLYDSISVRYMIEGEENLRNGIVFNLEIENDGLLSIEVARKSWRVHREIRNKVLPTHISIVRYDLNPINKYKTFSDYTGTTKSLETCTLNKKVQRGNYLIYIYRDTDHSDFFVEPHMVVKITCSANFKHAQMANDLRDDGFPLLQNIIFQSVLEDINYDFNSGKDVLMASNSFRNNGLGYLICYYTIPGNVYELSFNPSCLNNMFLLSPYINNNIMLFQNYFPSGKFIVHLGLRINECKCFWFVNDARTWRKFERVLLNYQDNDIDLHFFTNINNDIKNFTFRKRKTQSLENVKIDINFDINYSSYAELEKIYSDYFRLLNEIPNNFNNNNLKWGVIKINNSKFENYLYIGQINNEKKEGRGIFVDSFSIFVGEFQNNLKNGVGITYNKDFTKRDKFIYINDIPEDRGTVYFNNKPAYEGCMKDKAPEGKGTLYTDHFRYEGDFKNGKMDGKGTIFYKNGDRYEGEVKNISREGKGVLITNQRERYEGDWKNNVKEGRGILYFRDGSIYDGEWKNDSINGKGVMFLSNGDRYEGSFKNNFRDGKGIHFAKIGNRYEGDWLNNLMHGKGVEYYENGDREMGDFFEGKKVGAHAYLYANGRVEPRFYGC